MAKKTYYTIEHEWIEVEQDIGTVGITDYAQKQLGDVVFVELPSLGKKVIQGKDMAVVESVKAASEVYAPVTGEVTAINQDLSKQPDQVNKDPTGKGWFVKLRLSNPTELSKLMDLAAYQKFIKGLS
ncbi:MAG TPA: glycine cleavage system protein GcvH [Alphaproteobacteria bacterium]|jgi:glycine cleavage system H protein|nr:glycine cleavage system protein GcvH [Alphaproteobacteria bacterium]